MSNSWIRIGSVALMINIIFDLTIQETISDFSIGTAFSVILVAIIYLTIELDKIEHNKNK